MVIQGQNLHLNRADVYNPAKPADEKLCLQRVSDEVFERIKEKTRLFFLCSYSPLSRMSERCDDSWGYALFDNEGNLLRIYAGGAFRAFCEQRGIRRGTRWSLDQIGNNAVGLGIEGRTVSTLAGEHESPSLRDIDIYFHPIFLDAESICNDISGYSTVKIKPRSGAPATHSIGIYGGIAILCDTSRNPGLYDLLILATAREVSLQVYWFNVSCRDMADTVGFISINQRGGGDQIMLISSGIYKMFGLPMQNYHLEDLQEIIDPPPKNEEFWAIVRERRAVTNYCLNLSVKGHVFHVRIRTRRSTEEKFCMHEVVVYIQSLGEIRKSKASCSCEANMVFDDIIAEDPAYKDTLRYAQLASLSESNILLLGESGTGKDILAQAIHNRSSRKHGPFVVINCAAFSKELIASELFGYEPGAFTGASKTGAIGKFQLADGGTLFLDEIGDMPLDLQANLLRAIEQKSFMKVGGSRVIKVNVRIIAATNRNLAEKIQTGEFREDLFYRLGVVRLIIPPLRSRLGDILPLAHHFLSHIQLRLNRPSTFLSDSAKEFFLQYSWPGNVRELQNLLEGVVSVSNSSVIQREHIHEYLGVGYLDAEKGSGRKLPQKNDAPAEQDGARKLTMRPTAADRELILAALEQNNHNCAKTARDLGISRRTLYRRLEKYDLLG